MLGDTVLKKADAFQWKRERKDQISKVEGDPYPTHTYELCTFKFCVVDTLPLLVNSLHLFTLI